MSRSVKRFLPRCEPLDARIAPAIISSIPSPGTLFVGGDAAANTISISRTPAGIILVNGATVPHGGGVLTVAQTSRIIVNGLGGNDTIALSQANGGLPRGTLNGGTGNDKLTGSTGKDQLNGGQGNDTLQGRGAKDTVSGGLGNDLILWNSGDGDDVVGGGDGADTVQAIGTDGIDAFTADPNGDATRVILAGTTSTAFTLDIGTSETLDIDALGGDDTFTGSGLAGLIALDVDGGDGNDTLNGGNGADILAGGAGDDAVDGNGGNDNASLGDGNDTFVWDPGDGSDVVEGGAGSDTLRFNGSAGAEIFAASANGARFLFTRNIGNIVMDTDDLERLDLNARGGADTATVNDLTGTDVTQVNIDLSVNGAGDAAVDAVVVNGTAAADVIQAAAVTGTVQVSGLTAQINVIQSEAANDILTVNGQGGNDTLSGGVGLAALVKLTLDGGDGNDTINGGNGADVLIGGDGNDTVDGNGGNDTALMGDGNDTFVWDPGDGSDVVEGQAGFDTLLFNGAPGAEIFAASSNGGRLLFTRNVGNIVMDCDDLESLTLNALGGIDTVTVNDLGPTDVTNVNVNLGVNGAGDTSADAVTVNGTVAVDVMSLSGSAGSVTVQTAAVVIAITNAEPANDDLTINTSGGDDIVSASGLANSSMQLTLNGGNDNDILVGSQGNDTINGDAGDDLMFGGPGDDTFTGGTGTDTANGGAGNDVNGGGNETFNQ